MKLSVNLNISSFWKSILFDNALLTNSLENILSSSDFDIYLFKKHKSKQDLSFCL